MSDNKNKIELYRSKHNFFEKIRIDNINKIAQDLTSVQPMTANIGQIFTIKPKYLKNPWKKTFAWLPVKTVSGKRYWLKSIYVRTYSIGHPNTPFKEYGDTFDILRDE